MDRDVSQLLLFGWFLAPWCGSDGGRGSFRRGSAAEADDGHRLRGAQAFWRRRRRPGLGPFKDVLARSLLEKKEEEKKTSLAEAHALFCFKQAQRLHEITKSDGRRASKSAHLNTDVKADRLNQRCQTHFIMLATYFDSKWAGPPLSVNVKLNYTFNFSCIFI